MCLAPLIDAKQAYRVVTSEFTHENPAYFALNMVGLLVFGNQVERIYGTAFCAILHFVILTTSTMLSLGFYLLMAYYVPDIYRGGSDNFFHCASGYSNIVFGLAMISCL